jgi:hypothetical protein
MPAKLGFWRARQTDSYRMPSQVGHVAVAAVDFYNRLPFRHSQVL